MAPKGQSSQARIIKKVKATDVPINLKVNNFFIHDELERPIDLINGIYQNCVIYLKGDVYLPNLNHTKEQAFKSSGKFLTNIGPIINWEIEYTRSRMFFIAIGKNVNFHLDKPADNYLMFMESVIRRVSLIKDIITYVIHTPKQNHEFEGLIKSIAVNNFTEEFLTENSRFVCDELRKIDSKRGTSFLNTSCFDILKTLCQRTSENNEVPLVITDNVRTIFRKYIFNEKNSNFVNLKTNNLDKKCSVSKNSNCGNSSSYQNVLKKRYLQNSLRFNTSSFKYQKSVLFKWLSDPVTTKNGFAYYKTALLDLTNVSIGDFVLISPLKHNKPSIIGKIIFMRENVEKLSKFIHVINFARGSETILGEIANPREIFVTDCCKTYNCRRIVNKIKVEYHKITTFSCKFNHHNNLPKQFNNEDFFYTFKYDSTNSRFFNVHPNSSEAFFGDICPNCESKNNLSKKEPFTTHNGVIIWKNESYSKGSGIFLDPYTFDYFINQQEESETSSESDYDEDIYTEKFRKIKMNNNFKFQKMKPYCIGLIDEILEVQEIEFMIRVRIFCRPENTNNKNWMSEDLNLLYWTPKCTVVSVNDIKGKCHIAYFKNLHAECQKYFEEGPLRFYFNEGYDFYKREFIDLPENAKMIGDILTSDQHNIPQEWPKLDTPLVAMDVFAGIGGFSEGLKQSGLCHVKWAIENDPVKARSYKLNHPDCSVFQEDCNVFFKKVLTFSEPNLPKQGEVQLLIGGPPCQGFTTLNRYASNHNSVSKNSLLLSFLGYVDYYRPTYIVLENVKNFVLFEKQIVFKLMVKFLLTMGYQLTFQILQAALYGVPQKRQRLVLLASASGYNLASFPDPLNVFSNKYKTSRMNFGSIKVQIQTKYSAPYRSLTVYDAISDLGDISKNDLTCSYKSEPKTHYQKRLRKNHFQFALLTEHKTKNVSPLTTMRISLVPPGNHDWRDLPNIQVKLSNGIVTKKLLYKFPNQQSYRKSRAVCSCAFSGKCTQNDHQINTVIPWSLPHTANRQNNWAGVYGRLYWSGVFSTTLSKPKPLTKQGRVLHPEYNRIVSIRECARSQGFPDHYIFYGTLVDKFQQVGNAVPPPLSLAIGREIIKAIISKDTN